MRNFQRLKTDKETAWAEVDAVTWAMHNFEKETVWVNGLHALSYESDKPCISLQLFKVK